MDEITVGSLVSFNYYNSKGEKDKKNAVGIVRKTTDHESRFWVEIVYPYKSRESEIVVRVEDMIFLTQLQPATAAVVDLCLFESIVRLAQKIDEMKPSKENVTIMCQT